ncbi:hypothetical protein TSUD_274220 [Trifolium subterraneum]|uniref:Reverse transcriptase domain-containing protein n=1 Tax=Trifolium subterraneum TaxID=3900 RepID=A0A2Z6MZW7_TRISU|nr:hypothetical protein TSUD_274220 [Trifolium subterraneum]
MPPKNQNQLIRVMDAKITSLEEEIHGVKATLASMEKSQATLIAMFERSLGKVVPTEEEVAIVERESEKATGEGSTKRSGNNKTDRFRDDAMTEFHQSAKKIELPMFDGKDPAGWISRAEVYFRVQETTPEVKEALLERYGGHGDGDVYEQLTELRQTVSMEEYITEFEYLTAQIPKLPDKQFLGYILHGLKHEIKGKVRSLVTVGGLSRAKVLQVTRAVEKETSKENGSGYYRQSTLGYGPNRSDAGGSNRGSGADWVLVKTNKDISSNGDRQLRLLIIEDENEEGQEGNLLAVEVDEEDEETEGEISVLSFQQLTQNTVKPQSIKLKGVVDTVLGMEWVQTLGDMIVNWNKHTMSFWYHKQWVTLKGMEDQHDMMNSLQIIVCSSGTRFMKGRDSLQTLEVNQSKDLENLLNMYADVFQEPKGLPTNKEKEHVITLKEGAGAVNVRPYRYPHHHKNEIERQVKEMLEAGIICHSTSAFSSPIILVKKKDSSWRMCIDYRALNKATIPDKFPIPVIEELLDELHGSKFFSKLDLKSGYHQVRVKEEDIHKTTFRTHEGHYEFMVMPFGLMNAPSTFQSLMNEVFRPFSRTFVLVFFDDILVFSKDWQTNMEHLEGDGVAVDPNKVMRVTNWPVPKNVKGVRGFLGLTGYYRKFIKDYGKIARTLTELTKKDAFTWNETTQRAFDILKEKLTTAPVLALPDFNKEFIIECDALGVGIGAILMQEKKPGYPSLSGKKQYWWWWIDYPSTRLKMSTAYHPETDGQTELVNRCLETYLRCFIADQPKHGSIGFPGQNIGSTQASTQLQDKLLLKLYMGELLQPLHAGFRERPRVHKQKSVVSRIHAKLSAKYYGPYPVIARVGAVAYQLKLPTGARVHPIFHVSLLKKVVGNYNEETELPNLRDDSGELIEPESTLASRYIQANGEQVQMKQLGKIL